MPDHASQAATVSIDPDSGKFLEDSRERLTDSESWLETLEDVGPHEILRAVDWTALFRTSGSPTQLLDIGCGPGRFPRLLRSALQPDLEILYDYLDPSTDHLARCRASLALPYQPRHAFHTTFEAFFRLPPALTYDIVWTVQAFPPLDLPPVSLSALRWLLNPHRGTALIVLAKQTAFCHQMRIQYDQTFPRHEPSPSFLTAEQVHSAMNTIGMKTIVRELDCTHGISLRDEQRLDRYLRECVKDERPSQAWRYHPRMRDFLETFRHGSVYRFPHPIWLILSAPPESGTAGRHRLYSYLKPVSTQLVA